MEKREELEAKIEEILSDLESGVISYEEALEYLEELKEEYREIPELLEIIDNALYEIEEEFFGKGKEKS